jgi:hypothetical protein
MEKKLQIATSNDFELLSAIPVSEFGAKIGVQGQKNEKSEMKN